jgi:hypothetical protein
MTYFYKKEDLAMGLFGDNWRNRRPSQLTKNEMSWHGVWEMGMLCRETFLWPFP